MLFGAHVSVSRGYLEAFEYARSVGCECMQIFAKSPRQWKASRMDADAAQAFIAAREAVAFGPLFTHTAYLINLSTDNDELREKSVVALADELVRGTLLGAAGVVTHIGNDPAGDVRSAGKRAGASIAAAFELAGKEARPARLLLENTAGAGRTFGGSFEEVALAIDAAGLPSELLGMCLDTCHAFAYGMEVDTSAGWSAVGREMEAAVGMDRLGLIHANDCRYERGAHKDRHEWIGDGFIGIGGFAAMTCEPKLESCCVVTEMPGDVPEKDAVNIARLVGLRDACEDIA